MGPTNTSHKEVHGTATGSSEALAQPPLREVHSAHHQAQHHAAHAAPHDQHHEGRLHERKVWTVSSEKGARTHVAQERDVRVAGDPRDYQQIRADRREPARTEEKRQ